MANIFNFFYSESESSGFEDLQEIAKKIIPDDIWAFVVQLTATFLLVLILAKFLVKPVRKFVEARQAYIQKDLDEAKEKNAQADINLSESNDKLKEAKKVSKEMVETAKVTALNEKDRIIEETKEEVRLMKDKAKLDIESERKKMKEEFTSEVIDVALSAASKVVEREINKEDNSKIIESFINEDKE